MKKIISLLLSVCMLLSVCTGLTFSAQAAEAKAEYTYSITVKTTNDADGWNAAYLRLEDTTVDSIPYKEWNIQSSIDDSNESFTTTFSDTRFYNRVIVYVSFGGGLTWHDWAGRITASVNGIPQIESNVSASSSPNSPSSSNFEYFMDLPYPTSVDIYTKDAGGNKDYDFSIKQSKDAADASGDVYLSFVDQYNTYWNNWKDFTIASSNDVYSVYETMSSETRIKAKSSLGEDHTDTVSLHGVTYNTEHETFDNSFNVKFAFWHKVTAAAAENGTVTASVDKAYTGDTVTLTPFAEDGYALESVSVTDENGNDIAVTDNKFTMPGSDVTVNATFAPTTYIARFVADGKTVAEIPYTVNTTEIDEPDVPVKPGYTGAWKPYTLGIGGITVEAEYEQVIHDFRVSSSTPATCTSEGYDTYTCIYCGETYNKTTTPALGHNYKVASSVPATCTAEGIDTYKCSVCGDTYTKKTPVIAHNYKVTDTVAASCDTEGYETYICSVCGDTYNKATTPAKGHQFVVTGHKSATCTEDGYQTYKCIDCDETFTGDYTPAKGHNYVAEVVAPTCFDEGYTTYTCDVCGETRKNADGSVYKTNITAPVPHIMNNAYTEYPTCNEFGQKVSICINCGYIESDILSPTGDHNYDGTVIVEETSNYIINPSQVCTECGHKEAIILNGWFKHPENGRWLFLENNAKRRGWLHIPEPFDQWYYLGTDGYMVTGLNEINGKLYYFDGYGVMQTGWKKLDGKWYYLDEENGDMKTGWQRIDDAWYYLNKSGEMQTGWQKIGSKWYYLNPSGAMVTGWKKLDGKWYYLDEENGDMKTGWQKIDDVWYYLNKFGAMVTSWKKINEKWYYFNESGSMRTARLTENGKVYRFATSGACINP